MKKQLTRAMISFLLISTLLTGCGASAKSESYMIAETMAAGAMDMSSNPEFYPDDVVMEEAALEKVESESGDTGSGLNSTSTVNTTPAINRKLIRTVNLNVETDAFDTLLETLNAEIAELNGYVEQSDISGNSMQSSRSRRWAHMTVRIPSTSR